MVDFSNIAETIHQIGYFSIPKLVFFTEHMPVFDLGAFFTIAIVFLVSAAETTGATTAVCKGALNRDIQMEELQGSLAVDGFSSAISGCFGFLPLTSFSQNVYYFHGSFNPDTSIVISTSRGFLSIITSISFRWMYSDDVWFYHV